jgi:hypothetical protein
MNNGRTAKIGTIVLMALFTITLFVAHAHARDVLFLGLINDKGESVHQDLERAIRLEFSANPSFRLIGELETERIVKEIDRLNRTRTELFVPPSARIADSTIIIRGLVGEPRITGGRSWLLWGKVKASMRVRLYFNELNGPASYNGEFSATAETKRKNFTAAQRADKTVHASASDRSMLIGEMREEIVRKTSEFATLFFNSLATGPVHRPVEEVDANGDSDQD